MTAKQSTLRMRHTEPRFWQYATTYIMLGSGVLIVLLELASWVFQGGELFLVGGSVSLMIGVLALVGLKRTKPGT